MRRCFASSVFRLVVSLILLLTVDFSPALAEEHTALKGRGSDAEGQAVEGAMVFVYDKPDVKKPADFISSPTAKDGLFQLVLPPGKYWLVARLKKAGGFGPLTLGDRHSGEPTEVELLSGGEVTINFIVADIKEAIKIKTSTRERPYKISGRILDEKGTPVSGVYAIAHRDEKLSGMPDYLSAWADSDGRYTLYVPRGTYYIGSAISIPPGQDYFLNERITIEGDKADLNLMRKSLDVK